LPVKTQTRVQPLFEIGKDNRSKGKGR